MKWRDTLGRGKDDSVYREYMARLDRKIERNAQYSIKACFARYISPLEKREREEEKERRQKEGDYYHYFPWQNQAHFKGRLND